MHFSHSHPAWPAVQDQSQEGPERKCRAEEARERPDLFGERDRRPKLHRVTIFAAILALAHHLMPGYPLGLQGLSQARMLTRGGVFLLGSFLQEITVGKGFVPSAGDTVTVHYSLFYNGDEIESSRCPS